ncbi:MAG: UDP-N-acetylmuramoyl-tripeptide--D-alanyl-D-alanine ligase [Prevotellaceae bacterium]|jgi:UDP-N-acetylmuramoyl-tripeptide--D-alanyl-D-alanine ligase|nr:UDP-N-acetylmuramoyl-tripeptide--D-alanyl-D-alanine ligase [Prevotellaceae bacterium]
MNIEQLYSIFTQYPTITTDSRNCPVNSLFFALKGANFNGNAYAKSALEKGCAYAVIDEAKYAENEKFIVVNNVLETLQQLAHYHRISLGLPVIGITGTNGKTTTKELISSVLSRKYRVLYTQGNLNNHIGVPLTLLSLTAEHQIAVVEMGANHPGEIKTLVEIAAPNAGIVTNVGKAHLEGFGSFEGVIKTKSEMYDFLRDTGGCAFVNLDNDILMKNSEGIERIGYGLQAQNGLVSGEITGNSPFLSMRWKIVDNPNAEFELNTQLIGAYNAENVMAAVCIACYFGVEPQQICEAINAYTPSNNRSQFTQTARNRLIVDAYNANPTSMQAAIRNFAAMEMPAKMLILGDMRELGADSAAEHRRIVDLLEELGFERVFLVGECFGKTKNRYQTFDETDDLLHYLQQHPVNNATVLIKGSNGLKLTRVVEYF